ncbi:MAG: DUF3857 domain-containing protein [Bacteroidota bacterium]
MNLFPVSRITSVLALVILVPFYTIGQAPEKFGKVSKDDLKMTVYPQDTSAKAVVLFDYATVDFHFNHGQEYIFEQHRRIKILDRAAFDYADIALYYYVGGSDEEKINNIAATIHNPDGSSEKMSKKDFFREEVNENLSAVKFSFPNVQVGSVIEYKYTHTSPYLSTLPEWYFQEDIPVRWSEYNTHIPEWFNYLAMSQGRPLDMADRTQNPNRYNVSYTGNGLGMRTESGFADLMTTHTKMVMKDVPALREESFITNMNDYRARVRHQLQSTNFSGVPKPVLQDWPTVSKLLVEASYFGEQYTRKKNLKAINDAIYDQIVAAKSATEKAWIIYKHINDNVEWNENFGFSASEDLSKCYEKKSASAGEMNLMILGMLKKYGIQAYPLLVSTREHGKMIPMYPILDQFNHVMVLAILDEKEIVIDAGNKERPLGMPRMSALNGNQAFLVDPNMSQWIKIPTASTKSVQMAKITIDEDGMINGSIDEMKTGYHAVSQRNRLAQEEAQDLYEEDYTEEIPEIEITKVSVEPTTGKNLAYKAKVAFNIPNQAMINGDFIYFNPMLNQAFEENPFKLEKREFPVDFTFPFNDRFVLVMDLPEGYTVEELPETVSMSLPEKGAQFVYSCKQVGQQITVNCSLKINKLIYMPEEYAGLKKFFDLIVEKQGEQIVLKFIE